MSEEKRINGIRFCERCGVEILDEAWLCPLCRGALTMEEEVAAGAARSLTYPELSHRIRKMRMAIKITVFASALIAVVLCLINYLTFSGHYWSLLAVAGLAYVCLTLILSFRERKSPQVRILIQFLLAAVLLFALDRILGHSGWAVRLGYPILILAADVTAVVMMMVHTTSRQNYIVTEIIASIFSVLLLILELTGVLPLSVLGVTAAVVSVFLLAGTLLFGQSLIREEVKRRFRV